LALLPIAWVLGACASDDPAPAPAVCPSAHCFAVGNFSVDWDGQVGGSLQVRHGDEGQRVLWQSPSSEPLLTAGFSPQAIDHSRGSFTFDTIRTTSCQSSQIEGVEATDDGVTVSGTFTDCDLSFTISYSAAGDRRLRFEVALSETDGEPAYNQIALGWDSHADEGLFGFGAQYDSLNMKGRLLPIWCQEQGHGRGLEPITELLNLASPGSAGDWHTSYTAVPYFMSTDGYGLLLENSEYIEFDMQTDQTTRALVLSNRLTGQLLYGANPLEIVQTYTEFSGRMAPLPEWSQNGAIVRSYGGADAALDRVTALDSVGAALGALWVEDWAGTRETLFGTRMWWNWQIDRTVYPEFEDMVSTLNDQDVRTLIYFNPFLTDASEKPGVERNLFAEADAAGYLVQSLDGETELIGSGGFDAGLMDLTRPEARDWLKGLMAEMIGMGVSGWMADFGEALPIDIQLHSGVDPAAYHNVYPYEWALLNREVAEETGVFDEHLTFSRSGNARSPSVSRSFWIGDQLVTWDAFDGFQTVVPALLSSGLSGYSMQHADTGGWLSVNLGEIQHMRTHELFQRWLELNTFTALVRLHTTNLPELNHQYDSNPETLAHFARMTQVFAALAPYRKILMDQAAALGTPIVRHPLLHYPDDSKVYTLKQQFMLGSDFMIAPVVDEGATQVTLYLPAGAWIHLWTGTEYGDASNGVSISVDAPIGEPAVFYRAGSDAGSALVTALEAKEIL